MAKRRLTAIVPVFNEVHNLREVLDSVRFADEVLVVDSFSTDGSVALAASLADRVIQREYQYSASQKNWAIPQAANEWILLVDADERVSEALQREITALLNRESLGETAFWVKRRNWFLGKRVRFSGWQNDRVIRLFHRDLRYEDKHVHSEIRVQGKAGQLQNALHHNTARNMEAYLEKWKRYARWKAEDAFAKGVKPGFVQFFLEPPFRFWRQYLLQGGILDGWTGLVICGLEGSSVLLRYFYLWGMWRESEATARLNKP
ncbi:MAG: glycosyltransferase [Bacteroidetes bacterium]|nr:glycosyltransferase [Bacteroidota bacterium]